MCVVLVHFCNIIFTNTHSIGKAEGERTKSGEVLGFINPRGDWEIKTQFQFCEDFDAESAWPDFLMCPMIFNLNAGQVVYINDTDVWGDFSAGLTDREKRRPQGLLQ